MTFIASVVAKDGVAIVTDSFVTSEEYSINWKQFSDFIATKGTTSVEIAEVKDLFELKPSYTRNFTEKLFEFNDHSVITTAGHAYINEKPISEIVDMAKSQVAALPGFPTIDVSLILTTIKSILVKESTDHINKFGYLGSTSFIFSHYNLTTSSPEIYKIRISKTTKAQLDSAIALGSAHDFISFQNETGYGYVTDGQDTMIDRLLFGSIYKYNFLPKYIAQKISKELKFQKKTRDKIDTYLAGNPLLKPFIDEEIGYINRRPLSLQEAVDLAALLVRIVINIQAYTEKIPTVGGVIKLAVIDKRGIKHINGHEISKPNLIY